MYKKYSQTMQTVASLSKTVAMKPVALVVSGEPPYIVSVMQFYISGWR